MIPAMLARSVVPAVLALAATAAGCSFNKIVADNMAASFEDSTVAFNREGSPRHAREASPALLKMLDGFIVSSPENPDLLLKGAEMNATFAFAFIEKEDQDWARELYRKARDYAMRGLATEDETLHAALTAKDAKTREAALKPALAAADEDDVRAVFWTAFAWGGLINMSRSDIAAAADLPLVVAMMERVAELDPDYNFAGSHLFLGVYHARAGRTLGGDPKRSEAHFREVFKRTRDRFLIAYELYAEYTCVALGETEPERARAEFTRALTHVVAAPADIDPEQRLANAIAKERAAALLPQLDDLIFPPLPPEPDGPGGGTR